MEPMETDENIQEGINITIIPQIFSTDSEKVNSYVPTESEPKKILTGKRLNSLIKEVNNSLQLEEDVEETLIDLMENFVDNIINSACQMAKHRKASAVQVKDAHMYLRHVYNMWIPGFGGSLKPYRKSHLVDGHRLRLALLRKTLRKY